MPQLDSSAIWTIVGIVVGIIVTAFFFFIGKKKIILQYYKFTSPLITERMAGILNDRMTIDGQPVNSLSMAAIIFLNSGNQRIKSSDYSVQEPLRVILKGHLYGYDVSLGNQKLVPKVTPVNEKELQISFENLKPRQYFGVLILHDKSLDVLGELTTGTMREYKSSPILNIFSLLAGVIAEVCCGALICDYKYNGFVFSLSGAFEILVIVILSLAFLLTQVLAYKNLKKITLFDLYNPKMKKKVLLYMDRKTGRKDVKHL